MIPTCETHMCTVVAEHWRAYIVPRYAKDGAKQQKAWKDFAAHSLHIYLRLGAVSLQLRKKPLDFDVHHLRLVILRALEERCTYCARLFGLDSFGVVQRVPLQRGEAASVALALNNQQACCLACSLGKDYASEGEWARVVAAVRAMEPWVARRFTARLAGLPIPKGTSRPAGPASNARAPGKNQAPSSKTGLSTGRRGLPAAVKTSARGRAGLQAIAKKRAAAKSASAASGKGAGRG